MSLRPLLLVSALIAGDYLLWSWSLSANHDVIALISGLTLPPLGVMGLWLLALNGARLIARGTRPRAHTATAGARAPAASPAAAEEAPADALDSGAERRASSRIAA